jgi:hypothetical protein
LPALPVSLGSCSDEISLSIGEPAAVTLGPRSFAGPASVFGFGLGVLLGFGLGSFAGTGPGEGPFAGAAAPGSGAVLGITALGGAAFGATAPEVAPVATALGGVTFALERGVAAGLSPRPRLSIQPPATARPTSISSTTRMRPHGRRATIGIDIEGSSSGTRDRGGIAAPLGGLDASGAYTAGGALLIARGGGALGGAIPGGFTT